MIRKITLAAAAAALIAAPIAVEAQSSKDIVATAIEAGTFKTLAQALQAADLVGALQGEGPFTVFAPTDAAFAKLPPGTLEALLADKEKLVAVLTYHVVSGKVMSDAVVNLDSAMTLSGVAVPIEVRMGRVHVGGANVTTADVAASNGVIHVIDAVMLPKEIPNEMW